MPGGPRIARRCVFGNYLAGSPEIPHAAAVLLKMISPGKSMSQELHGRKGCVLTSKGGVPEVGYAAQIAEWDTRNRGVRGLTA